MPTDLYYGILLFGLLCLVVRILYIRCSYSYSPSPIIRLFFHISTKKNNKSKMMHIFVKSFNFPHTYRQPSIHCHLKTYPNTGQRFVFFYGLQFFFLLMHGYQVGFTPSIVFGTFFFVILLFTVFFSLADCYFSSIQRLFAFQLRGVQLSRFPWQNKWLNDA